MIHTRSKPLAPALLCLLGLLTLLWPLSSFGEPPSGASDESHQPSGHGTLQVPSVELAFPDGRDVVEVAFRLEQNKIILPVTINGAGPYDFVLDTGASHALLHTADPPENLEVVGQSLLQGAGHGESTVVDLAGNVTFGLEEVELRHNLMAVTPPDSPILERMGRNWQGVFGRQVFDNLVVEIDWTAERLRLHHPDRFEPTAEDASLPLELANGHAYVQGEVTVAGKSRPARFVLDTGAYHAVALGAGPRPAKVIEGAMLGRGLNGKIHGDIARLEKLRLGPYSLAGPVANFPEEKLAAVITSGSDGNIGSEVLRRFTATFDYARDRLLLRPNGGFGDPFTFTTSGLRLSSHGREEGLLEIDDVYEGSPARAAGVTAEDRLAAVNGRPVSDFAFPDLLALLEEAPGTELSLLLDRGGERRELSLVLREVL